MHEPSAVADLIFGICILLLLAAATQLAARRVRLPFTIVLVVVGIALAQLAPQLRPEVARLIDFRISPDLILYVFLPSLIFESALHLDARALRDNLAPVLTLAVPGLLISTGIIAAMVAAMTDVPFAAALVLGAILSATDPVAVIALFQQLGAPARLTVLVEGESLFNDATAIVAAKILLAVAVAGFVTPATIGGAVVEFALVFVGGIVVGTAMAYVAGLALGAVHENQAIEISILTTLAYLSFIVGEEVFHVSGVMATLAAGLTIGGWGRGKISPGVADYIEHFWAYVAFVANALIFLLVGLAVDFGALLAYADVLLVTVLAMLVSRAVVIFGLAPLGSGTDLGPVSRGYLTVMYWGGLRGAVALAVVLSLGDFAWAPAFTAVVMGAVLFTLVVQGLTIEPLMRRLGLDQPGVGDRLALDEARIEAGLAGIGRLPELAAGGLFSAAVADRVERGKRAEVAALTRDIADLRARQVDDAEALRMLWLRCLATERIAYYELFGRHHIDERAYRELEHGAALRLDSLRHAAADRLSSTRAVDRPLSRLARALAGYLPGAPGRAIRTRSAAREYVKSWAEFQACDRVLASLALLGETGTAGGAPLERVERDYRDRRHAARGRLDDWAEQFPEFVRAMQERLAERLVLRVEHDEIAEQVHSGLVPHGLGDATLEMLEARIRALGAVSYRELEVDPAELLRKVPLFSGLAAHDVTHVVAQLKPLTVAPGEDVIREGESGTAMYFIARGVVRVLRGAGDATDERELATLIAGDFFGEIALLSDEPRSATCRAATACALYELSRAGVDAALPACPALRDALAAAAAERSAAAAASGNARS